MRLHPRRSSATADADAADAVRILYGGSVKPDERRRAARASPTSTARSSAAPRWRPTRSRRSSLARRAMSLPRSSSVVARAVGRPDRARRLGAGRARARQRRLAGAHAGVRRAVARATRTRRCARAAATVGLPDGQMGNSEVGHLNLGAGRDRAPGPRRASTTRSPTARLRAEPGAVGGAVATPSGRLHLIGLVSDGGVHSSLEHLSALHRVARGTGVADVVVHAFTDGRDTLPHAGAGYLAELDAIAARRCASARSSAATGRWTATGAGIAPSARTTCSSTARARTARRSGEEAVASRVRARRDRRVHRADARRRGRRAIGRGDSVIAFNFRPDRMRQLTRAPGRAGVRRAAARRRRRDRRLARRERVRVHDDRVRARAGPTRSRSPPERPATTLAAAIARSRRAPAARRRDREVSARHLLLQRRRARRP